MVFPDNFEQIKRAVSEPMDWYYYDSTIVRDKTNSYSHAIGSTVISNPSIYRPGVISGRKKDSDRYKSREELKEDTLSDLSALGLHVCEISPILEKDKILDCVSHIKLESNQHIIVLFAIIYEDKGEEKIRGFHFLRYDADKGWSEKKYGGYVHFFEDISMSWPSNWYDKPVAVFKITR